MVDTILLSLMLLIVLLKREKDYSGEFKSIEYKLYEIDRTMIKKTVHKNIECPKCMGEGFMYTEKYESEGLLFVEDPEREGYGNSYCRDCNGHGELYHDGSKINPPEWDRQ